MELDRRLKLRNHQMPQFEQEEEEWEMSPVAMPSLLQRLKLG